MRPIEKIAVIRATGRLGEPVVAELAKSVQIRAIVRSPEKARKMLPSNVEIIQGSSKERQETDLQSCAAADRSG